MAKYLKSIIMDDDAVLAHLKQSKEDNVSYPVRYSMRKCLASMRPDRDLYHEIYECKPQKEDVVDIYREYRKNANEASLSSAIEKLATPSRICKFKMIMRALDD